MQYQLHDHYRNYAKFFNNEAINNLLLLDSATSCDSVCEWQLINFTRKFRDIRRNQKADGARKDSILFLTYCTKNDNT